MHKILTLLTFFCFVLFSFAQKADGNDSSSLLSSFKNGEIKGQLRYFFMATDNEKRLSDYYANATGARVSYNTGKFKGFQFGLTQSFEFNIASSDFNQKDPATNASNRYEVALFDVTDVNNKTNLARLDELYLKYTFKQTAFTLGRQNLNTPFLNTQDGRMMTSSFGGLWITSIIKKWYISGGWLISSSPRGTTKFYSIEKSLGLHSNGVDASGSALHYLNSIESKGIGVAMFNRKFRKFWNVSVSDYLVENVFNTTLIQVDFNVPTKWFGGVQYIHQNGLNVGGNVDPTKRYFEKNGQSNSIGVRIGRIFGQYSFSLNYNHITKDGQFLLPREWGREPLFTFIQRERSEGLGNTNALVIKSEFLNKKKSFGVKLHTGAVFTPDIKEYELNKYGLSSYYHTDLELKYLPIRKLKNLEISLLITNKKTIGETYSNPKNVIKKVNMFNYNLILNYNF
ncbi:MAG: outer membrane porin, OprD family [Crocinitomicaceae bacterium]|nr:MAG: outer membrane porin, OprD family [Crocinitomicaceae bacterium]